MKNINFSSPTVSTLKRNLIAQIDIAAKALCECPVTLRYALENGVIRLDSYISETGDSWIYVNLNNHDYVIPYVRNH